MMKKLTMSMTAAVLLAAAAACSPEQAANDQNRAVADQPVANDTVMMNDAAPGPAGTPPAATADPEVPKPVGPITKQIPPKGSPLPPAKPAPRPKAEPDPHAGHDMNKM